MSAIAQPPVSNALRLDRDRPWPGLATFDQNNAAWFHGRTDETIQLLRLVERGPLVVMFARSGLGKSSLIQAGLFPAIEDKKLPLVPLRVEVKFPTADQCRAAPVPVEEFVRQAREDMLREMEARGVIPPPTNPGETLYEYLHRNDIAFRTADGRAVELLLVFDQFEEFFTLGQTHDSLRRATEYFFQELAAVAEHKHTAPVRARFQADPALTATCDPSRRTCRVLIALRQEFLAELDGLRGMELMPNLLTHTLHLQPLARSQALEAVLKPGGHLITPPRAIRIVDAIIHAGEHRKNIADAPRNRTTATATVDPAILSLVCASLNEKRFPDSSGKNKRTEVLPEITDEIVDAVRPEDVVEEFYIESSALVSPALRRFIEDELSTEDGYRATLPETDALKFCPSYELRCPDAEGIRAEIGLLEERRIINREPEGDLIWLRLGHDLLAEAAKHQREVREANENARRFRKKLLISTAAALVALAALAITGYFYVQSQLALESKREALTRAETSEQAAVVLKEDAVTSQIAAAHTHAAQLSEAGKWRQALLWSARAWQSRPLDTSSAMLTAARLASRDWMEPVEAPVAMDGTAVGVFAAAKGDRILALSETKMVIRDSRGASLHIHPLSAKARCGAISPDGELAAAGLADGKFVILHGRSFSAFEGQLPPSAEDAPQSLIRVDRLIFSPNSQFIAVFRLRTGTGRGASNPEIWGRRDDSFTRLSQLEDEPGLEDAAFSNDGKYLLVAAGRQVFVYGTSDGREIAQSDESSGPISLVRVNPDPDLGKEGQHVTFASASEDAGTRISVFTPGPNTVLSVNLKTGKRGFASLPNCLEWLPDGAGVVTAWDDGSLVVLSLQQGLEALEEGLERRRSSVAVEVDPIFLRESGSIPVKSLAISPEGTKLSTLTADGVLGSSILPWKAASRYLLDADLMDDLPLGEGGESVAFSSDGSRIIAATRSGITHFISARRRTLLPWTLDHKENINSAMYLPKRHRFLLLTGDRLAMWDAWARKMERHEPLQAADLFAAGCSGMGLTASASTADRCLRLWNVDAEVSPIGKPQKHDAGIRDLQYSEASGRACTLDKGGLHLWKCIGTGPDAGLHALGKQHLSPGNVTGTCDGMALSQQGDLLLAWWKKKLALWQITPADDLADDQFDFDAPLSVVTISPDSTLVACGVGDRGVELLSLGGQGEAYNVKRHRCDHSRTADALRFSPDGKLLAGGLSDHRVMIWEATTGKLIAEPMRHAETPEYLEFSSDNRLLLVAAGPQVHCWDVKTGRPVWAPFLCREHIREVHFMENDGIIWVLLENSIAILPVLRPAADDAAVLAELAEISAGATLDAHGVLQPVQNRWVRLVELRQQSDLSPLARWLLTPDAEINDRPVAPEAPMTFNEYLTELWKKEGDAASEEAAVLSAGSGLESPKAEP